MNNKEKTHFLFPVLFEAMLIGGALDLGFSFSGTRGFVEVANSFL